MAEKAQLLYRRVLVPLVTGGPLHPLEPIGPDQAVRLASTGARIAETLEDGWVQVLRVRRTRMLLPVETIGAIDEPQWLLAVAVNDLLQASDPQINTLLAPRRADTLLDDVQLCLSLVPAPQTLGEALGRHATFGQVLQTQRCDTAVQWWCGSATFCGRAVPKRLTLWPNMRRVRTGEQLVDLAMMASHGGDELRARYRTAIRNVLQATPLTDLATAARAQPSFAWSETTLSLMLMPPARQLAARAIRMAADRTAVDAIKAATAGAAVPLTRAMRNAIDSLVRELSLYGEEVRAERT